MQSANLGPQHINTAANSQEAGKRQESFGLSALTRCLVDADGNTAAGAGRARRKALGVSAFVQFCTLAALLIVPLFATGSRLILHHGEFVPIPPYGGAPPRNPQHAAQQPTRTNRTPTITVIRDQIQAPSHTPTRIISLEDTEPTASGNPSKAVRGGGDGSNGAPNLLPDFGDKSGPVIPLPESNPAPLPRKPIAVSQGVQLALLIHRVEPVYPNFARQTHREGTVELRAIISSDGTAKELQVLSGDPVLAKAARDAVAQWRFRPTMLNGIAVEVVTFITVNFHLGQ